MSCRSPRRTAWIAATMLLLAPPLARAHDARLSMATERLMLRLDGGKRKLVFSGFGDSLVPTPLEPPSSGAAVLVVAAGADGEGRSALLPLDATRWKTRTKGGGVTFVYRDRKGKAGPVRKVVYAPGALTIKAAGAALPWTGTTAPARVDVLFRIGAEWHCASAPVTAAHAAFRAKNAFAPDACPTLVCGDGERGLGEPCDDGNLDDADACTNDCALGECAAPAYASTWEAIQTLIFERHGCTSALCHGAAPGAGDLDLRSAVAYRNLVDVPSSGGAEPRLVPGAPKRSFLWLKLAAKTNPGSVAITGDAMPSGLPALGPDELEALRIWIHDGAPETGVVGGIAGLLDACLPPPTPIEIEPLAPPAPGSGVQFRMPPFTLPADSETEVCFAQHFDFTSAVPPQFLDAGKTAFYTNGYELRQDPHSHHLQIIYSGVPDSLVHDPSFGAWTCKGGAQDGAPCEPLDLGSCGPDGLCGSAPVPSIACIGYGPPGYQVGILGNIIGGAQTAQSYDAGVPGFYAPLPLKGVIYWNSHAFNLTGEDTTMHAYSNHYFTDDLRYRQIQFTTLGSLYAATGTPPYTERTVCSDFVLPQGSRLLYLTSHTHKRARHFWVEGPGGERLYDSFTYSDPEIVAFDPPRPFDAAAASARTLHYCATYNNGVTADGQPDPTRVRRLSTTPPNGSACPPVACTAGRVGAACAGAADGATCDSGPDAGDGVCDACAITSGVSTEDEMFLLIGGYVMGDVEG